MSVTNCPNPKELVEEVSMLAEDVEVMTSTPSTISEFQYLFGKADDWVAKETEKLAEHYLAQNDCEDAEDALVKAEEDMKDTVGIFMGTSEPYSFP